MELMSTSFDKFYKYVYCSLDDVIPEEILGKITLAVSVCHCMVVEVLRSCLRCMIHRLVLIFLTCIPDCESTESLERKLENNSQR